MKKKTFFRGLATSFAVATLGLTSVALTSCEKESLSVQPSDVNNTYTFNYSELASYLNQWGIASEASLQKVLSSQLTKSQIEEILNNWDPSYQTLKDYLDNNYKPDLENIKNTLDAWNPTLTQLQLFLAAWDETLAKIDGISESLESFLAGYTALSPASATIFITAYNFKTGELLVQESKFIEADEEGKIAQQVVEVESPVVSGYVGANSIKVTVPALGKGQSVLMPITFYLVSFDDSGLEAPVVTEDTTVEKTEEVGEPVVTTMDPEDVNLEETVYNVETNVTIETGQKVENIDKVYSYIDNLTITRAMTDAAIKATLKNAVDMLNTTSTKESAYVINKILPGSIVNVKVTPIYESSTQTMTFTVDDIKFDIPNIIINRVIRYEYVEQIVVIDEDVFVEAGGDTENTESVSHTGNAHGTGANAGGGTAGK